MTVLSTELASISARSSSADASFAGGFAAAHRNETRTLFHPQLGFRVREIATSSAILSTRRGHGRPASLDHGNSGSFFQMWTALSTITAIRGDAAPPRSRAPSDRPAIAPPVSSDLKTRSRRLRLTELLLDPPDPPTTAQQVCHATHPRTSEVAKAAESASRSSRAMPPAEVCCIPEPEVLRGEVTPLVP